jgi:hypothetical protein
MRVCGYLANVHVDTWRSHAGPLVSFRVGHEGLPDTSYNRVPVPPITATGLDKWGNATVLVRSALCQLCHTA